MPSCRRVLFPVLRDCCSDQAAVTRAHNDGSCVHDSTVPVVDHTGTAASEAALRPDAVTDGQCADAVLSNAPRRHGQYFTVPKFGGRR